MARRISSVAAPVARDTHLAGRFGLVEFVRRLRDRLSVLAPEVFHRNLVYNHILFLHSFMVNKPEYIEHVLLTALSRSWVLLVNSAGRSQPACLYFNALGHSSPSQIGSEIAYSWPM